jgi:hypothetical protein
VPSNASTLKSFLKTPCGNFRLILLTPVWQRRLFYQEAGKTAKKKTATYSQLSSKHRPRRGLEFAITAVRAAIEKAGVEFANGGRRAMAKWKSNPPARASAPKMLGPGYQGTHKQIVEQILEVCEL